MVVIDTYEIVKKSLYSVQFDTENVNEFRRIFDFWRNATSLESFFEIHKNDLEQDFWK